MDDFFVAFMRFLVEQNRSFIDIWSQGLHLLLLTSILEINEGSQMEKVWTVASYEVLTLARFLQPVKPEGP